MSAPSAGINNITGNFTVTNGYLIVSNTNTSPLNPPVIELVGAHGSWQLGIDSANNGGGRDLFLGRVNTDSSVSDVIYLNYNTGDPTNVHVASVGIGITPPTADTYRVQVAADDNLNSMGTMSLRVGPTQTGHALDVLDSAGHVRFAVDAAFTIVGEASNLAYEGAIPFRAASFNDGTFNRALTLLTPTLTEAFGFGFFSTTCYFRCWTSNSTAIQFNTDGSMVFPNLLTLAGGAPLLATNVALTDRSSTNTATLTNAPVAGNPTKWFDINDAGTTRRIPAW